MKKKYLLLNFVIVTATTNSFTMITKFSPIKNTSKQSYRLKSTQNNFQNKHSNDFQAIGLYNKLQSLQLNIVHEDTKDLRKTPWDYSCGTTPWDFYKVNFDKSGIDSWSSTVIGSSYKHIDTITDD